MKKGILAFLCLYIFINNCYSASVNNDSSQISPNTYQPIDTSVQFGNLYTHGGCVPVPTDAQCPSAAGYKPNIYVVPVQVLGNSVQNNTATQVYPISSFQAYATGGSNSTPPNCFNATPRACMATNGASTSYWRVCLKSMEMNGDLNNNPYGNTTTKLLALVRCVPPTETVGSDLTAYEDGFGNERT